ncbi:hypothetical protein BDW60DRAFT_97832 [Aspergillus nidulans var. acristatus]
MLSVCIVEVLLTSSADSIYTATSHRTWSSGAVCLAIAGTRPLFPVFFFVLVSSIGLAKVRSGYSAFIAQTSLDHIGRATRLPQIIEGILQGTAYVYSSTHRLTTQQIPMDIQTADRKPPIRSKIRHSSHRGKYAHHLGLILGPSASINPICSPNLHSTHFPYGQFTTQ